MKTNRWSRRKPNGEMPEDAPPLPPEAENPTQPADGLSEAGIREALRDVRDPEIGKDLISLNMIREV
ncbi:MAG: iron-sulfur cluster assembly protein, partial [Rubrobacteraceae bacterium]